MEEYKGTKFIDFTKKMMKEEFGKVVKKKNDQCKAQCGKVLQNTITQKKFREINSLVTSLKLVKSSNSWKNADFSVKIVIAFYTR